MMWTTLIIVAILLVVAGYWVGRNPAGAKQLALEIRTTVSDLVAKVRGR